MQKRFGLVVRADEGGLASLSWDFYKHLEPTKTLVVLSKMPGMPDRFPGAVVCRQGLPNLAQIEEFLDGLDVIMTFEKPYNWNLFKRAKKKGIKTILVPNYEWTDENPPEEPDLYICPSKLDFDLVNQENKVYLPIPIDREMFPFKLRKNADIFVFNNGHGGSLGRNGLKELLEAIAMVSSRIPRFIINSQVPVEGGILDSRVTFHCGNLIKEKLYSEGDVFLFPHKFDGLSLPIQEAMSSGMPIISTNLYPFNTYLPKELLFEPDGQTWAKMAEGKRTVEKAVLRPRNIAEKIEEWVGQDITKYSKEMNKLAEEWSWNNQKDNWIKIIEQ